MIARGARAGGDERAEARVARAEVERCVGEQRERTGARVYRLLAGDVAEVRVRVEVEVRAIGDCELDARVIGEPCADGELEGEGGTQVTARGERAIVGAGAAAEERGRIRARAIAINERCIAAAVEADRTADVERRGGEVGGDEERDEGEFHAAAMMPVVRLDASMNRYVGDVPGASVLVMRDGATIIAQSFGLADVEAGVCIRPETNFRLASITKQFTAYAVMILADRGVLAYDDAITRWLSELPAYARDITIRQLLLHTCGLPDYEELLTSDAQVRDADVVRLIAATRGPDFAPGTRWRYSNTAYVLLGEIVARASDMSFSDFLHRELFAPLGMHNTTTCDREIAHRAFGYTFEGGAWVRRDQSPTTATLGDGGIYSSIIDLAKWDAELDTPRLVSKPRVDEAMSPLVASDDPAVYYGFGWRISEHRGVRIVWHSGETVSFRNVIVRFPSERMTIAILTNRDDPEPYASALALADALLARQ